MDMKPNQKAQYERGWNARIMGVIPDHLEGWALIGWQDCEKFYSPIQRADIVAFDKLMKAQGREYVGAEKPELVG